ncbi:hypothetical protein [Niallia sp. 01092]|uniref:hypothetical protein n=1 Tax=unclassified Niallia TaxID=2837522 RepID=UPI003FD04962
MTYGRNMQYSDYGQFRSLYDQYNQHTGYHVMVTLQDGQTVDGIIENVDNNGVSMLVGEDVHEETDQPDRQYGGGAPYRRRFRRFRRRFFPLAALTALALFPYYYPPYPYPYPYYPY